MFLLNIWRGEKAEHALLKAILVFWLVCVVFTTLIVRTPAAGIKYHWMPLWSWMDVIINHNMKSLQEIILNVILFFPIGFISHLLYRIKFKDAFLAGLLFSAVIEIAQLITCRGFFEWDDMLHNGLGCLLGTFFAVQILKVQRKDR